MSSVTLTIEFENGQVVRSNLPTTEAATGKVDRLLNKLVKAAKRASDEMNADKPKEQRVHIEPLAFQYTITPAHPSNQGWAMIGNSVNLTRKGRNRGTLASYIWGNEAATI